jgi:hypothetical protein
MCGARPCWLGPIQPGFARLRAATFDGAAPSAVSGSASCRGHGLNGRGRRGAGPIASCLAYVFGA